MVVNHKAGNELHLRQGPFCPPPASGRPPAHHGVGNSTDSVTVLVKLKRPLSTSKIGVGGAVGTEVGKGATKEVMKPKMYPKVFGGGTGKLQDVGVINSWAYNWWHRPG